ncbi:nucleotidyltransferase substrate binding protein [Natronospora cellulosivora (SeqCode)]
MIEKDRLKEKYLDFKNAYQRLDEALAIQDQTDIVIDGTIQRFEFTFELSWKLMKYYLEYQGFQDVKSPRATIRTAFQEGLIIDGEAWIDLMVDRNKTSHLYDEKEARKIFKKIQDSHIKRFEELLARLKNEL